MARSTRTGAAPRRARNTGLPDWTSLFLAELANTSNVTAAAKAAKVSTSVAYDLRRNSGEFNRRWYVALCEGYDNLEMDLLHRVRMGELKPLAGAKKAMRAYDNATAFRLLAAHRESAARQRAIRDSEDSDVVLARINAKLERMRQRVAAAATDAAAS